MNTLKSRWYRLLLYALVFAFFTVAIPASSRASAGVWGTRPLLSYFVFTQSLTGPFQRGADLTDSQFALVEQIAYRESADLQSLLQHSQNIVSSDAPLWWKRLRLLEMGYNRQVDAIVAATEAQLQHNLDTLAYQRLVNWVEQRWPIEQQLHVGTLERSNVRTFQPANNAAAAPRTYRVYATRYDSNGRYTVALPDKCVKFTNGGNSICADYGYMVGQKYQVFITYNKSVGVVVAESGPWNVDDTYWATWGDPTPRRMFADVGLGIPEAQAAYFNGYNGGQDQFGRKVTGPYGIDLAREVSVDIGLKPGKNDWVTVTFQWTEGWGSSGGTANTPLPGSTSAAGVTAQAIVPVEFATPKPDGSIVHTVQPGQTLWDIATTYSTTLRILYNLNGLSEKSVIWPGDQVIIRTANPTPTGGGETATPAAPSPTPQIIDATGTAWAALAIGTQAVETVIAQIYASEQTPATQGSSAASAPINPILIFSLVVLILGAILLLVGRLLR